MSPPSTAVPITADGPPLRLLVVTSLLPTRDRPDFGVFNTRQVRVLAGLGVDVRLVVPRLWLPGPLRRLARFPQLCDSDLLLPEAVRAKLAWYLHPPGAVCARFEGSSKFPAARRIAADWHRREPVDVVLGIDMTADAVVAVRLGEALGVPVATLAIGSDVTVRPARNPSLRTRLARTIARVDLPLAVSEATCRALADAGACRRPPLAIYLGRDRPPPSTLERRAEARRSLGIGPDDRVGVFVGRLTDEKGMPEFAEAARPLLESRPGLRLILVGEGPHEATWRAIARGLDRPDRIVLPGRVAPGDVHPHLVAADFLVFPSRSEGLPQAVVEAMDHSLPVVGTAVGGIPEAVVDGVNGLLVPAGDAAALGAAMARMIDDDGFRAACAEASLARAVSLFDAVANGRKMVAALRSIVPRG